MGCSESEEIDHRQLAVTPITDKAQATSYGWVICAFITNTRIESDENTMSRTVAKLAI